jgi:sugar/nucleoside kinase (ribokinase family)
VPQSSSRRPTVLVIGDVATDTVVRLTTTNRVDHADTASTIIDSPGGQGANTACWLATAGANVQLLASVSSRDDIEQLKTHFRSFDIEPLLHPVDAPRTRVISVLAPDGSDRSFFTQRGAAAELSVNHLDHLDLGYVDWIHVSGYLLSNAVGRDCYARIRQLAAGRNIPLSVDPASLSVISDVGIDRWKHVIGHVNLLIPNADEARLLSNKPDLVHAAADLRSVAETVIVKHARHGAHLHDGSTIRHIAAVAVDHVVDPTGAGDAFAAGLINSLASGCQLSEAVGHGHALGAACIMHMGAAPLAVG